jgi:hypothetical protein
MYEGWRLAPIFQAFSSLEKPSHQRFAPVVGLDRERRGAELAISWDRSGLASAQAMPFVAFETIASQSDLAHEVADGDQPHEYLDADRYAAGLRASFRTYRGRGSWAIRLSAAFQGALGHTEYSMAGAPAAEETVGTDWRLLKLYAGLSFRTPIGSLSFAAEDGRLDGDYGIYDLFHLGGQAVTAPMLTNAMELNRVSQPALPAYLQMGDRMRGFRVAYNGLLYYERMAVWDSRMGKADYQRVVGAEIQLGDIFDLSSLRLGIHRPLDGEMAGRTVFTVSIPVMFSRIPF